MHFCSLQTTGQTYGVEDSDAAEPSIIFVEELHKDSRTMAIISCEGIMLIKLTEDDDLVVKTLVALLTCYYVYDVKYPKEHEGILQLLEDVLMEVTESRGPLHKVASYRTLIAELMAKMDTA